MRRAAIAFFALALAPASLDRQTPRLRNAASSPPRLRRVGRGLRRTARVPARGVPAFDNLDPLSNDGRSPAQRALAATKLSAGVEPRDSAPMTVPMPPGWNPAGASDLAQTKLSEGIAPPAPMPAPLAGPPPVVAAALGFVAGQRVEVSSNDTSRPSPPPPPPPSTTPTTPTPTPTPTVDPTTSAGCNPPYVVGSDGVKRWKKACLF